MEQPLNELGQPVGELLPDWKPPEWPRREAMRGRFCRLEPIEPARHAAGLFAADSLDAAGASWTYLPYGPFRSFDEYAEWMQVFCLKDDPLFFAIVGEGRGMGSEERGTGGPPNRAPLAAQSSNLDPRSSLLVPAPQPLGVSAYLNINPKAGSIEVGHVHYSPRLQQRPAATETQYLLMRHAFELGYRRYEWKAHALNAASRAAALRLGFTFEGVFRQAAVVKGRNRDTAWYSITDAEWPRVRAAFERWLAPENFDAAGKQRVRLGEMRE
jgi:RimJ/RimL family protein N-acetyltransferase